jgi:hypothetical protein
VFSHRKTPMSIGNDAYLSTRSRQIAFFALRHALPTISESREGVTAGLLMSYGPNQSDSYRQAGLSTAGQTPRRH